MSDETPKSSESTENLSKSKSDTPPKRRRRRRGANAPRSDGKASEGQETSVKPSTPAADPASSSSSEPGAKSGRRRRRTRRKGNDSDRPQPQASTARSAGAEARKQGRKGPHQGARKPLGRSIQVQSSATKPAAQKKASAVVAGKQQIESAQFAVRGGAEEAEPRTPTKDVRWGDDSDAPTPEVVLAPDLPPAVPADDWDPASAYLSREGGGYTGKLNARVCNIIGVRFARAGRMFLYDAGDGQYERGCRVVVEGERGERIGTVAVQSRRSPPPRSLKKILRRATADQENRWKLSAEKVSEHLMSAKSMARNLKLPIKVFDVQSEDDGKKLVFYYSCEEKNDVRRLTRALSEAMPCKVDLRHTGPRDEAKLVGGIGACGMELCCTTWLPAFVPVSIKHAKDQGLALNPTKIAGQCGRLKCCLVYEQENYATMRKGLPKLGKRVVTNDGFEGRVVEVDVLRQRIRVGIGRGESKVYQKDEVKPMFASQPQSGAKKDKGPKKRPSRSKPNPESPSPQSGAAPSSQGPSGDSET